MLLNGAVAFHRCGNSTSFIYGVYLLIIRQGYLCKCWRGFPWRLGLSTVVDRLN